MEKTITDHPQPSLQHAITTVTMISRRTYLTSLTIGLDSISSCLRIFDAGGSGDENSSQGDDTGTGEGEVPPNNYEAAEDTPGEKCSDNSTEPGNDSEDEGNESDKGDRKATPDDEETEIDREQYDDSQEETEVTEADESDLETSYDTAITYSETVEALGIVENTIDTTINAVDFKLITYGTDDAHVGSHLESIHELGQARKSLLDPDYP